MPPPDPIHFQWDLALWSFGAFLLAMASTVTVAYMWYQNRPQIPAVLLTVGIIVGMSAWPILAVINSIFLVGLIISTKLRISSQDRSGACHMRVI